MGSTPQSEHFTCARQLRCRSPRNWQTSGASLTERRVPDGKHGVPATQNVLHHRPVRFVKQVWFAPLGINVRVSTEERRERPNVIPPDQHLGLRVAEKSTNVSWTPQLVNLY